MDKPKVICLMPVKNEAYILPLTLSIISKYCDKIIIADQMSTDGSREIYKNFPKVEVIDNKREKHTNKVRWDLLNKAREYGSHNLIICLDADEYFPSQLFEDFIDTHKFKVGESFRFPWIQLWKDINFYNLTGAWYKNYQRCAWVDDGETLYENEEDILDDLPRVPKKFLNRCTKIESIPIIHLQWIFWDKTQIKQAWYKCIQLIHRPGEAKLINIEYAHTKEVKKSSLKRTPEIWISEITNSELLKNKLKTSWHLNEIVNLFNLHSVKFFEDLELWHIPELMKEFNRREGRKPRPLEESLIHKILRQLRIRIIKIIYS